MVFGTKVMEVDAVTCQTMESENCWLVENMSIAVVLHDFFLCLAVQVSLALRDRNFTTHPRRR